jgi:NitT/TauT family transport system substrate-binding protein
MRRAGFLAGALALPALPALAQTAGDLIAVHAGGVLADDATPLLYAQSAGIFRRYGIDVTFDAAKSGSTVAAAVIGGSYLVGKSSLVSLATAYARGVPVAIVAPAGEWDTKAPVTGFIVKPESPIKSAADLNGTTIGVSSINDQYTITTKAWIDQHGGDSTTIKLVEIPSSALATAVAQGRIDGGTLESPHLQVAIASGAVRLVGRPFDSLGPRWLYSAWFTTRDQLAKSPKPIDAFVRAIHEATVYTNAHHADTVALLAKATSLDPDEIAKATRTTCGESLDPREIQPLIDGAVKYKVIPAPFSARELIATPG